ncbi:hypothetical protein E4T44_00300 [Aureobasidium sp. EXF-8845]|nr:hypothetical protein E4T44_00300 [Aureobasidium sp. EXF-8845]KAI4855938.1 hypothetical protein E4T45_02610 [Aureobasidium sp. EXF-8846]
MHFALLVAGFAAYSYAQNLDADAIAQADPVPTPDIPVVYSVSFDYALPAATVVAETIAYDASAAAASASVDVAADVNEAQPTGGISKRDDASCAALQAQFPNSIYISPINKLQYTINCGYDYSGYDLAAVSGSSFANCYDKCDGYPGCVSFSFAGGSGAGTCYLKRRGANTAKLQGGISGGALVNMPTLAANLCVAQPTGISHTSSPDTDQGFIADTYYPGIALAASPPTGYTEAFKNSNASNNALGYLGFSLMSSYDTSVCAARCDKVNGCLAINIYFERDPSVDPNDASCVDPTSYTQIKCVYWGGPVTLSNALNFGQYRNKFHVVIAGSNGYVSKSIDTPAGYTALTYLGNSIINAPNTDCAGYPNLLNNMLWPTGPFDAGRCAAACSAYNANPPASGVPQTCRFFNTYVLKGNGKDAGQYCALYQQAFPSSVSTSSSVVLGGVTYTYGYSYTFTSAVSAGGPAIPCAVASASSIIGSSTLQGFCSTLLGYNAPTSTATVIVSPTSTILSTIVPAASSVVNTQTITTFVSTSTHVPAKRAEQQLQTPAALSFPASVISAACSLQASSATSTVLTTTTSTASTVLFTKLTTATASTTTVTVTSTIKATATANPNGCAQAAVCSTDNKISTYSCPGQGSKDLCACGVDVKGANVCYAVDDCTKLCKDSSECANFGKVPMVCVFNTCCNNNGSARAGQGNCLPVSTTCKNAASPGRMFKRGERKFGPVVKRQESVEECTALSCPGTWVDETTGVVVDGMAGQL